MLNLNFNSVITTNTTVQDEQSNTDDPASQRQVLPSRRNDSQGFRARNRTERTVQRSYGRREILMTSDNDFSRIGLGVLPTCPSRGMGGTSGKGSPLKSRIKLRQKYETAYLPRPHTRPGCSNSPFLVVPLLCQNLSE